MLCHAPALEAGIALPPRHFSRLCTWAHGQPPRPQLLPPRTRALADEPAFIARFGTSKAAHMLAAVAPTPLALGQEAIEAHARSLIAAASSEAFPPEHFYIFDLGAVYERWRVWTTSLPRVTPYYAGALFALLNIPRVRRRRSARL